jgi:hypothetical protein
VVGIAGAAVITMPATAMTRDTIPCDEHGCPDLQKLVDRAGRRHAASIGEEYVENPFKRPPHQGGYPHVTAEEWAEFDRAMADWQARRRAGPKP